MEWTVERAMELAIRSHTRTHTRTHAHPRAPTHTRAHSRTRTHPRAAHLVQVGDDEIQRDAAPTHLRLDEA